MNHNYPEYIMKKLREFNYVNEDDASRDSEFQELSPEEVFDQVLKYDGIIGYRNTILRWIADIFKVKLIADGEEQSRTDFILGLLNILMAQNLNDNVAFEMADVICETAKSVQNQ